MKNETYSHPQRVDGYAGLGDYAAIGVDCPGRLD